ncbi:hypothetical protein EJB05_25144, partial [Eragrostis curvula]
MPINRGRSFQAQTIPASSSAFHPVSSSPITRPAVTVSSPLPMAPGSVGKVATVLMVLCCVIFVAQAAVIPVGGGTGWTFGVGNSWARGKQPLAVGDVLVFQYAADEHNVVQVDQNGYNSCKAGVGSPVHTSGDDRITLTESGKHFFICTFPGHCSEGMRIAVTVN